MKFKNYIDYFLLKRIFDRIKKEIKILSVELAAFIFIILFFYGSVRLFFGAAYNNTKSKVYNWTDIIESGLIANFFTPYVIVTFALFIMFFYLIFRFLARERAETFGVDISKPNYLSAGRDYLAVIFISVISGIQVYYPLTGSLFIPVAILAGIVFAWWAMAVVVNIGGFGEPVTETLTDLAVVSLLIIAGKTIPALAGDFAYSSPVEYFIEIGFIYAVGPGIGLVAYPGVGITIEFSSRKIIAYLQSFAVTVFVYFSLPFFAILPAFLLLIPYLLIIGFAALFYLLSGGMRYFGDFSSDLFFSLIFPKTNNVLLSSVFSPVICFITFFEDLLKSALSGWGGLLELLTFMFSIHYRLRSYNNRLRKKNEGI